MAEANRLPEDKLTVGTKLCVNHNTAIKNLSGDVPERLSGCGDTENNFGAARAVGGHQIMACSILAGRGNADVLKTEGQGDQAKHDPSYPSSLRSTSTSTSYSLEISSSSTSNNSKELQPLPLQTPVESRDNHTLGTNHGPPLSHPGGQNDSVTHSYEPSAPHPLETRARNTDSTSVHFIKCLNMLDGCQIVASETTNQERSLEKSFSSFPSGTGKVRAQPLSPRQSCKASFTQDTSPEGSFSKEKTVMEEEEMFYAFVILHAPEDAEEALRIQARLEEISSTKGATFSEDFAEPGRSVFRCVEDAIDNSAFIMLLLTQNFNTHLNEMNTDSALMNSIEKPHKYNTVIPLLPRANALANNKFPLVLKTKVGLDERTSKTFEMKAKNLLASGKILSLKRKWMQELRVKKVQENQRRLREENRHHRDLIRERKKVEELEQERMHLLRQQQCVPGLSSLQLDQAHLDGGQSLGPRQCPGPMSPCHSEPSSNIHIQNAKYIIIGNDSTMTVGAAGNNSGDEDCF